jgi:signal transduction histidine kinase
VRVRVVVEAREGVWVEVRNPLPVGSAEAPAAPAGSGLGLVGLRERVELAGGRLRHGVTARDRTFALDAWLPWPA